MLSVIKTIGRKLREWINQNRPGFRIGGLLMVVALIMAFRWVDDFRGRQNLVKGPMPLDSDFQIWVSYPRRLEATDRGTDAGKKIVVSVVRWTQVPTQTVEVQLDPVSDTVGTLQLLTPEGRESDGSLQIESRPAAFCHSALYVEHANVQKIDLSRKPVSFDLRVRLPDGTSVQTFRLPNLLGIRVDGTLATLVRDLWSAVIGLGVGGWLILDPIKEWWKSRQKTLQGLMLDTIEQLRKGSLDAAQESYGKCQDVLSLSFYPSAQLEELRHRIEAGRSLAEAKRALQVGDRPAAEAWLQSACGLVKLSEQAAKLEQALRDLHQDVSPRRAQALDKLNAALEEKADLAIQIVAAAGLFELLKKEDAKRLRQADKEKVDAWFRTFPIAMDYNPFEATKAEGDDHLEDHFFEHDAYREMGQFNAEPVALFADLGAGKSSCRRMMARAFGRDRDLLVVEYTAFDRWTKKSAQRSAQIHAEAIIQEATRSSRVSLAVCVDPRDPPLERLRQLVSAAKDRGYRAVYVLVDNVDACAQVQTQPALVESILCDLVGDFGLLHLPDLHFRFFLPSESREQLLKYEGFASHRIKVVEMSWDVASLRELLRRRLNPGRGWGPVTPESQRSLMELVKPIDWRKAFSLEDALVTKAQGSPRRMLKLVNMLFQHRTQIWHESGHSSQELYITMADWAALLEHLLRQSDAI